ncbi:MAG: hypothetical protein QNK32_02190 [Porticoccus sp.]|nr:hypothetical protein [Porticoccus sp.]
MSDPKLKPVSRVHWRKVSRSMPKVNDEFGESEYVTCLEESGQPFTGWYNCKMKEWFSADRDAPSLRRSVIWWKPLMTLPSGY